MIIAKFPFPPTTNHLFASGKGGKRFRSKRYQTWRAVALPELQAQMVQWPTKRVPGPVAVTITVERKDNRRRDIDNLAKAVIDALVECRVIDDDQHIQRLVLQWGPVDGARVEVEAA